MKKTVAFFLTLVLLLSCAVSLCAAGEEPYPHISFLTPISGGFRINFTACEDAAAYKVFAKTESGWRTLGTTTQTTYDYTALTDGQEYTFTVRGVDANGDFSTDYDEAGYTQTYYNPPRLRTLTCTQAGLKLTWDAVPTIERYSVYRKSAGEAWSLLALSEHTDYTDTAVTSGKQYTYTVKGVTQDGVSNLTFHDTKGMTRTFVAAPQITSFKNLAEGTAITWGKCAGAGAYRVFLKSGGSWKKLADTTACTYTHKNLKNNTSYVYTVRAINKAGQYVSAYRAEGSANTYFAVPKLTAAVPVYGGMKVSWNAVSGVHEYLVFVKTASGWKQAGVSTSTSYIDHTVLSGKQYTYTIKCSANAGKKALSWHSAKGITGTYVAAPEITAFENQKDSIKIQIKGSAGASRYRFFAKTASGWKAIATGTALNAVHKGVKNNAKYIYTVRALDKKGNYISAYNPEGKATRFFAPPAITGVTLTSASNTLHWDTNAFVAQYRVYKKTFGGSWAVLGDTDRNSLTDTALQKNVLYTYTLRYLNAANKPLSFYVANTKFYYNGAVANGKITYAGKTMCFTDGVILKGLIKRDRKYYYYNSAGFLQKNGIVGDSKTGYYYANKNGVIDLSLSDGIRYNNAQWLILNGKAKQVKTEYDKTLFRAFQLLKECTDKSMTKEQKLLASFRYLQKITAEKNPRIPHYTGKNWHLMYANDILVNRSGNCMSYGAAFAFMAKAIGYNDVYCCNSGGHGWAEVNHLVYDPEWDIHHKESYYAVPYGASYGPDYKGAISAGYSWMRVAI